MNGLALASHVWAPLLAEGASATEKRQAIGLGVGAFLGLSLLLFIVTRFNRDR